MANIKLHSDSPVSATSVSNTFIDEYMSDANGEFVKIYLYLLRLMNAPQASFSISSIADKFEHTEKDVKRALAYWERMHLLQLEYDNDKNLTGIRMLDSSSRDAAPSDPGTSGRQTEPAGAPVQNAPASAALAETPAPAQTVPAKKSYSADDILNFRQNESVAELFFIAERYLGRTLSATDINTLLYFYDVLGFSTELIVYLIESCVSNNPVLGKMYYAVMNAFGITGRKLVSTEIAYISRWTNEYGFDSDIILEACKRTMASLHQPNFKYTDSILSDWNKKQVHHLSDIAKLDAVHQERKKSSASAAANTASKNKFNNFTQRSYDYDELEQMLLTTNVH